MAFVPGPALPTRSTLASARRRTVPVCRARPSSSSPSSSSSTPEETPSPVRSRRDVLIALASAVTAGALSAATVAPSPASAKNGEGLERAFSKVLFPKQGFNAPDSLQPSGTVVDKEVLARPEAKKALAKLREYEAAVVKLHADFSANPQLELTPGLKTLFSISELRSDLNIVNEAIDEDSQIQTDKVVRGIIQDIGELQTAAVLKQGVARTQKKIDRTDDWFKTLETDFTRLLSFYN